MRLLLCVDAGELYVQFAAIRKVGFGVCYSLNIKSLLAFFFLRGLDGCGNF